MYEMFETMNIYIFLYIYLYILISAAFDSVAESDTFFFTSDPGPF